MKEIIKAVQDAMEEHLVNLLVQQFKQHLFLIRLNQLGVDFNDTAGIDNWNTVVDLIGFPKDNLTDLLQYDDSIKADDQFSRKFLFNHYLEVLNQIPIEGDLSVSTLGRLKVDEVFDAPQAKASITTHVRWLFLQYENYLELQDQ